MIFSANLFNLYQNLDFFKSCGLTPEFLLEQYKSSNIESSSLDKESDKNKETIVANKAVIKSNKSARENISANTAESFSSDEITFDDILEKNELSSLLAFYNKRFIVDFEKETILFSKASFLKSIDFNLTYDVEDLKEEVGDLFQTKIKLQGKALVRFAVFQEGHSFRWLSEKTISSATLTESILDVDLSDVDKGRLEFQINFLEDTTIFAGCDVSVVDLLTIPYEKLLQRKASPTLELCSEMPIFYKFNQENLAFYSFEDESLTLFKSGIVDLCTYFNSFSYGKWLKYTNVTDLSFFIKFKGSIRVSFEYLYEESEVNSKNGFTVNLQSDGKEYKSFELQSLNSKPDIIGFKIEALTDSVIYDFGYLTNAPVTQKVKIGIGITTFKREKDCIAASKRLATAIGNSDFYKDKISVTVVDNGQTITEDMIPKSVTLIPNRNLGGSGGFTRNLVHYKDLGDYTHCLFMDDDASCYGESIFRTYQLLAHTKFSNLAVSGAMFSANVKFLQWENGAWFDGCCHPLHCHFDMRNKEMLLKNELEDCDKPTYGAWWFFAFPIKHVTHYVFPFFVRGDDVQFSYINDFTIARMNGICTWQEDFKLKEGPMTFYLDIRSHLMHHILLKHLKTSPVKLMGFIYKFFMRTFINGYFYDTANIVNLAIKHVMLGPKYWEENLETVELRKLVKSLTKLEAPSKEGFDLTKLPYASVNLKTKILPSSLRKYSLNGHLLPNFMFDKKVYKLDKYETVNPNRMYLRKKVVIFNVINQTQFTLEKNSCKYFKLLFTYFYLSILVCLRYKKLCKEYGKYFDDGFTTDHKWKSFFKK